MNIQITAHTFQLTDAIHEHVKTQFLHLDKHLDKGAQVHVILHPPGHGGRILGKVEAKFLYSGKQIFADSSHEDVYTATNLLIPKLVKQIEKIHDKKITPKRSNQP